MPDSHRPTIFKPPEEPPLGYEAIRDWLQKPRPLLRRAFGWIPLLLSKLYDAGVFIRKTPDRERSGSRRPSGRRSRSCKRAPRSARGFATSATGCRPRRAPSAIPRGSTSAPKGRSAGPASPPRCTASGSRRAAKSRDRSSPCSAPWPGSFTPQKPISIGLRESGGVREDAGEMPESDGRVVPRQPDKRPSEAAGGRTEPVPKPDERSIDTASGGDAEETPAELPDEAPDSGDAEKEPVEAPDQQPDPGHADENSPESWDEPLGAGDAEEDAGDSTAETPEPDPESASESPARPERPPPPPTPPASPEDRFEGVPKAMLPRVKVPLERPSREVLYPLILDLCSSANGPRPSRWPGGSRCTGGVSSHATSVPWWRTGSCCSVSRTRSGAGSRRTGRTRTSGRPGGSELSRKSV